MRMTTKDDVIPLLPLLDVVSDSWSVIVERTWQYCPSPPLVSGFPVLGLCWAAGEALRSSLAVIPLVSHFSTRGVMSSLLLSLDALDARRGRRVACVSRRERGAGDGLLRDGVLALGRVVFDWEAEHLSSDEVGYIDVLGCWRRHVVGGSGCVRLWMTREVTEDME